MLCSLSREDAPEKRGLIEGEMTRNALQFIRSGHRVRIEQFAPRATLLDWLRLEERSTGTKEGCAEGDCGACAVVLARERDGRLVHESVNSCITLLGQIDGAELITVEDLAENGALHPVQEPMARLHGSQCGFCTPGIVMSMVAARRDGVPLDDAVDDVLGGHLCRCTGYVNIRAAIRQAWG
jgi:xanthine dehydrogenase small subunit